MAIIGHYRRDAELTQTGNVPATAKTVYSGVMDLGTLDSLGVRNEDFELEISLPAATTTHFPANTACAFKLQSSNSSTFASGVTDWRTDSITGGTAFAGKTYRWRVAQNGDRYWRIAATTTLTSSATTGSGAGDLVFTLDYLA